MTESLITLEAQYNFMDDSAEYAGTRGDYPATDLDKLRDELSVIPSSEEPSTDHTDKTEFEQYSSTDCLGRDTCIALGALDIKRGILNPLSADCASCLGAAAIDLTPPIERVNNL